MNHCEARLLAMRIEDAHPAFKAEVWPWAGSPPDTPEPLYAVTITVSYHPAFRAILSNTPDEWRFLTNGNR